MRCSAPAPGFGNGPHLGPSRRHILKSKQNSTQPFVFSFSWMTEKKKGNDQDHFVLEGMTDLTGVTNSGIKFKGTQQI